MEGGPVAFCVTKTGATRLPKELTCLTIVEKVAKDENRMRRFEAGLERKRQKGPQFVFTREDIATGCLETAQAKLTNSDWLMVKKLKISLDFCK